MGEHTQTSRKHCAIIKIGILKVIFVSDILNQYNFITLQNSLNKQILLLFCLKIDCLVAISTCTAFESWQTFAMKVIPAVLMSPPSRVTRSAEPALIFIIQSSALVPLTHENATFMPRFSATLSTAFFKSMHFAYSCALNTHHLIEIPWLWPVNNH